MNLLWTIYRPLVRYAVHSALVGKNRERGWAKRGRFTVGEVNGFVREAWQQLEQMAPNLPKEPTAGSRMNIVLAGLCYSMLSVLLVHGVERQYAIELIADAAWKVYQKWAALPSFFARLLRRNNAERMEFCVNSFLRFPFNPPGYKIELVPSAASVTAFNIIGCPVASFLAKQNALDLCVASWCNLDFALAEMWGGKLERTGTLAEGRRLCDFQFIVPVRSHEPTGVAKRNGDVDVH